MTNPTVFCVGDKPDYHETGVPWAMMEPHEGQAQRNHSQTLRRLHDRGGLSWSEALALLEDRDWKSIPDAKARVLDMVAQWKARDASRIEKAAIVLWYRFASNSPREWADETHKAEYIDAAKAALEAAFR